MQTSRTSGFTRSWKRQASTMLCAAALLGTSFLTPAMAGSDPLRGQVQLNQSSVLAGGTRVVYAVVSFEGVDIDPGVTKERPPLNVSLVLDRSGSMSDEGKIEYLRRAAKLAVAGAFHSPLMAPAAEGMARALEHVELKPLNVDVWSNVTGVRHQRNDPATLKKLLVEQIVSPVRWSQSCTDLIAAMKAAGGATFHELAPNSVLKGLMRRIDRATEVTNHDQPQRDHATQPTA
jgi:hypothetical protein